MTRVMVEGFLLHRWFRIVEAKQNGRVRVRVVVWDRRWVLQGVCLPRPAGICREWLVRRLSRRRLRRRLVVCRGGRGWRER